MPVDDEKEVKEVSTRDALVAAFDEAEKADVAAPAAEPAKEPDKVSAAEPKDVAKTATSDAKQPAKEPAKGAAASADDKAAQPIFDPPARWTKEDKEAFASADPKMQELLSRRNKSLEADYTRKMQEIGAERQRYSALDSAVGRHREHWQKSGMNEADALKTILAAYDYAYNDPAKFVREFVQQQGLRPDQLFPQQQQTAPQQGQQPATGGVPPELKQFIDAQAAEIAALRKQTSEVYQRVQTREQAEAQRGRGEAATEFQAFQNAMDAQGQPAHPFFEDVRTDMAQLLERGLANTLKDAYEKAVYGRSDLREKIWESRELSIKRDIEDRRKADAAKSRLAGSSVSASSSATIAAPQQGKRPASIRDSLQAAFDAAEAGERI